MGRYVKIDAEKTSVELRLHLIQQKYNNIAALIYLIEFI